MSVWSGATKVGTSRAVRLAEQEAERSLAGVGGPREWWLWNPDALVGHLRVATTVAESDTMPPGCAIHDAGPSGPERVRRPTRGR